MAQRTALMLRVAAIPHHLRQPVVEDRLEAMALAAGRLIAQEVEVAPALQELTPPVVLSLAPVVMESNSILRAQTRGSLVVVAVESTAVAPPEATGSSEREVRAEAALGQGPAGLTGRDLTPGTPRWVKWVYREAAVEEVAPVLPLPRDIAPPEVLVVLELWWFVTAFLLLRQQFLR